MGIPRFRRSEDAEVPKRVANIEDYLARDEEYKRLRDEEVARGMAALERRVSKLEAWQTEVLIFIGASKVRWGVVSFATAFVAALMTAAILKAMSL